ncbi:hypothetical protein FB45DRAFT_932472 [Roridomyces roridus]|uniref:MYND-type domain-containing protein n=1 Tax=Roridomyces roridus TaxID=1738132 RepID=A0AAD7BEX1_9AGAR|nr:hypothetical protein FB45DRAFT_932472 [Roridomyces roridus]
MAEAREEVWLSAWAWIQFLEEVNVKRASRAAALLQMTCASYAPPFASFVMSQPRIREFMAAGWLACLNLEDTCERQLPDEVMARISITLLTALALADHSPLKDDLVSNGIVDVLCRTLWVFGASDMPLTKGVLPFTMDRLITYMDVVPRMARLKEALDAGLLRAIMLCGTREDTKFFEKQVPTLLGSILPEAPLPQCVLSSLRAGLDDASPLMHTIAFRESKLFEGFLRATAVKLYRGELGHDKACNNVQCISSTKSDDDLKQCSKCRSAFYCSQQCQSQDWNAHRKFCRTLLRQREIRRGADEFIADGPRIG